MWYRANIAEMPEQQSNPPSSRPLAQEVNVHRGQREFWRLKRDSSKEALTTRFSIRTLRLLTIEMHSSPCALTDARW